MNNEIEEAHEELKSTFHDQYQTTVGDSSTWGGLCGLGSMSIHPSDMAGYYRVHLGYKNESYIKGPDNHIESTLVFKVIEEGYVCNLRLTDEEIVVIKKQNTGKYFIESTKYKLNGRSAIEHELMRFIGSVNLEG